jgi:hypothetical protein
MPVHGAAPLAMQSLKKTGHIFVHCMPCDKGRNGACMHGDGRRQHAVQRADQRARAQSPALRLHPCQVGRGDKRGR